MTILARERDNGGTGERVPVLNLSTAQQIAVVTASSTACTNAVGSDTTVVTVWGTSDFYIDVAATPSAATTGFAWPAYVPLDIKVVQSSSKIAARGVTAAGTLFIAERG